MIDRLPNFIDCFYLRNDDPFCAGIERAFEVGNAG
jgi:hypothetical protein